MGEGEVGNDLKGDLYEELKGFISCISENRSLREWACKADRKVSVVFLFSCVTSPGDSYDPWSLQQTDKRLPVKVETWGPLKFQFRTSASAHLPCPLKAGSFYRVKILHGALSHPVAKANSNETLNKTLSKSSCFWPALLTDDFPSADIGEHSHLACWGSGSGRL